ncbi:MAG: DUF2760 domain-containing protein [Pseudomonadota bacterium]
MSSTNPRPPIGARPSFFRRVPLAFGAFFRTIANLDFAARIDEMSQQDGPPPAVVPPPAPPPRPLKDVSPDAALQLLSLLQREGRLIDFTRENLANYTDADIGAAARVVHEGCSKVLREHFTIEPVRQESEGSRVTLPEGFDAASVRLTGNVVGAAPFSGNISHRGWRATEVRLPRLADTHDATVLAPAEVEL